MANQEITLDLPNAEKGKVVVRFPPEPSGYLHVGHAKALLLNEFFARKYEGKLIIRFDDTNPELEEGIFEDMILEDIKLISSNWDRLTHTSDYFDKIYEYAVELTKKGLAYADNTSVDKMREERFSGIMSAARNQTPEEALKLLSEMAKGTEHGSKYCLRAKIDMSSTNKALRDPVIYRFVAKPHHRTGNKWKIYPTYDFCCPVVDSIEKVTHALRTSEYNDRNSQYQWFIKALNLNPIVIWCFSRINFTYTLLSKRKLKALVNNKTVDGWSDPRFPTVRGMIRRGLSKDALREFIIQQGPSQNNLLLEWDKIWAINKKILEPNVSRHTALLSNKIVLAKLNDGDNSVVPDCEVKEVLRNKKKPEMGTHSAFYSREIYLGHSDVCQMVVGEEVTLMDWGNAIVSKLDLSSNDVCLELILNLQGDFKKTKKKLTWLAKVPLPEGQLVNSDLHIYDHIITKKKLSDNDDINSCLNPNSSVTYSAICDPNIAYLNKGDVIQFQRVGLFILDAVTPNPANPTHRPSSHFSFILIPDGKQKPPSLV